VAVLAQEAVASKPTRCPQLPPWAFMADSALDIAESTSYNVSGKCGCGNGFPSRLLATPCREMLPW